MEKGETHVHVVQVRGRGEDGRVLRPATGKERAIVYSIVASAPEIRRLATEAEELKEIAKVEWSRA